MLGRLGRPCWAQGAIIRDRSGTWAIRDRSGMIGIMAAKPAKKKDPAAVALGRKGGSAKTTKPKGLAALSKRRRAEIARAGVEARQANAKRKS